LPRSIAAAIPSSSAAVEERAQLQVRQQVAHVELGRPRRGVIQVDEPNSPSHQDLVLVQVAVDERGAGPRWAKAAHETSHLLGLRVGKRARTGLDDLDLALARVPGQAVRRPAASRADRC
jgi:hypothetical protein